MLSGFYFIYPGCYPACRVPMTLRHHWRNWSHLRKNKLHRKSRTKVGSRPSKHVSCNFWPHLLLLIPAAIATYGNPTSNTFHWYVFLLRVDRAEDCNRDKCPKLMEVCPDGGNCYGMSSSRPWSQTLPIRSMVVLFSNWWLWRKDMLLSDWNVMWIRKVRSLLSCIQN